MDSDVDVNSDPDELRTSLRWMLGGFAGLAILSIGIGVIGALVDAVRSGFA